MNKQRLIWSVIHSMCEGYKQKFFFKHSNIFSNWNSKNYKCFKYFSVTDRSVTLVIYHKIRGRYKYLLCKSYTLVTELLLKVFRFAEWKQQFVKPPLSCLTVISWSEHHHVFHITWDLYLLQYVSFVVMSL